MSTQRASVLQLHYSPALAPAEAATIEVTREAMFLQSIRDDGDWAAVPTAVIYSVVEAALAALGDREKAPEYIVELDLIYWADKGVIKPIRYYCKRWGWGRKQVHNTLVRHGFLGEKGDEKRGQQGDKRVTTRGQEGDKKAAEIHKIEPSGDKRVTTRGQEGDKRVTVYPDSYSDSYSERESEEGEGTPTPPPGVERTPTGSYRLTPIAHDGDGKGIFASDAVLFVTKHAYDVPDAYDVPLRAWIETHHNQLPNQHDLKSLIRLIDSTNADDVTRMIRRMGDQGYLKYARLEQAMQTGALQ